MRVSIYDFPTIKWTKTTLIVRGLPFVVVGHTSAKSDDVQPSSHMLIVVNKKTCYHVVMQKGIGRYGQPQVRWFRSIPRMVAIRCMGCGTKCWFFFFVFKTSMQDTSVAGFCCHTTSVVGVQVVCVCVCVCEGEDYRPKSTWWRKDCWLLDR